MYHLFTHVSLMQAENCNAFVDADSFCSISSSDGIFVIICKWNDRICNLKMENFSIHNYQLQKWETLQQEIA